MRRVEIYHPGSGFPAVSVTGSRCALGCPHCMGRPLEAMLKAETPSRLISLAHELEDRGAMGFLLSGGCGSDGQVPLDGYLSAVRTIKECTALRINAHVGLPDPEAVERLSDVGFDRISMNYPLSDSIGKRYFRTDDALGRYREVVNGLSERGVTGVVPHALIGLGEEREERSGIDHLASDPPRSLIFLAFVPLSDTPLESRLPTAGRRIEAVLNHARLGLPDTRLVLGCMRPRGDAATELRLMSSLLDGIVLPSGRAMGSVDRKVRITRREGCCALYL